MQRIFYQIFWTLRSEVAAGGDLHTSCWQYVYRHDIFKMSNFISDEVGTLLVYDLLLDSNSPQ